MGACGWTRKSAFLLICRKKLFYRLFRHGCWIVRRWHRSKCSDYSTCCMLHCTWSTEYLWLFTDCHAIDRNPLLKTEQVNLLRRRKANEKKAAAAAKARAEAKKVDIAVSVKSCDLWSWLLISVECEETFVKNAVCACWGAFGKTTTERQRIEKTSKNHTSDV